MTSIWPLPLRLDLWSAAEIVVYPASSFISAKDRSDSQLGRVCIVPYSFSFLMMELAVLLENFQHSRNYFIPFPRSMPPHNSISEFYGQFLGLHGRVSAPIYTVNCGTLYRKVYFSLNHVQSIELATGGLQSSCRDISRMIKWNWVHLSSIWSVIAKGLFEHVLTQDISVFHF